MVYTTKPPLGSVVNRYHPLSRGLQGCWLFNERAGKNIYDCVANLPADLNLPAAASYWVPEGLYLTNENYYITVPGLNKDYGNEITIYFIGKLPKNGYSASIFGGSWYTANQFSFNQYTADYTLNFSQDTHYARWNCASVINDANFYHFCLTVNLQNTPKISLYINGVYLSPSIISFTPVNIETSSIKMYPWAGTTYEFVGFWSRELSLSEVRSMLTNPYQMIAPNIPAWMLYQRQTVIGAHMKQVGIGLFPPNQIGVQ